MNKITSKEFAEVMRLHNVHKYQQQLRNDIITAHRVAKKEKNREEQARLLAKRWSWYYNGQLYQMYEADKLVEAINRTIIK